MNKKIGFLHPGEMGISLAASAKNSGNEVYWCSDQRSAATFQRAQQHQLNPCNTLHELCQVCDIIISVCPPHAALVQAKEVVLADFKGVYADVNAISPDSVRAIASLMADNDIEFVDGGIIGPPAWQADTTCLYLCGSEAELIASCFRKGPLTAKVLEGAIGKASALKMCFAANSKGVSALITAILSTAEVYGVRETLEKQWAIVNPNFTQQTQSRIKKSARKAWRFTGEMEEIAATLKSAGLPEAFHQGAADIYARQETFKDIQEDPTIEEVLKAVLSNKKD